MVDRGCTAVSMEVSSHALALGRVNGITFDVALFTNLSQDHLDFHHSLEEYFLAKAELFSQRRARHAVIDIDDEWGERLLELTSLPATTFSTRGGPADWGASDVLLDARGSSFTAVGPAGERIGVRVAMPGPFNVSNALGALVSTLALGCSLDDAARGIADLTGVPGRMERIDVGQNFLALVDYAHTPDAVANVLESVRATVSGKVIVVLGCGGDRDPHKRPAMGAAAVQGSDLAILTSDNPRSEDPDAIIAAMRHGADRVATDRSQILVEPDRGEAIREAVRRAGDGGAVVVAGKGHETGQEIAGSILTFDDRVVLRAALLGETDPTVGP
jgi:UDP-N-acetylmuramoyl-L-alanyl-D-glutamate--2,6-diaminopimelate ligase